MVHAKYKTGPGKTGPGRLQHRWVRPMDPELEKLHFALGYAKEIVGDSLVDTLSSLSFPLEAKLRKLVQ